MGTRFVRSFITVTGSALLTLAGLAGSGAAAAPTRATTRPAQVPPGRWTYYAGIASPSSITASPDGALWFTNSGNNSIGGSPLAGR